MTQEPKKEKKQKEAQAPEQQAKYGAPPAQTSKTAQGNPGTHKE